MRISKKYLVPYLYDSIFNLTKAEKIYWLCAGIVSGVCACIGWWLYSVWFAMILFVWLLLIFRWPVFTGGEYPVSERKYYQLVDKKRS